MKKNELSPEDFSALANAVADLPFVKPNRAPADYMLDLMETVINFHVRVEVVLSSLGYFRDQVQQQHQIYTHDDLKAVLAGFPDDEAGNKAASQFLWGNFMWTRIALLRKLMAFFESVGVTDQASLHAWAARSTFERDFKDRVKGLGIAVFHWLQIRCHVDSVKPDVHVLNFGKRVIGRRVSEKVLVDAISQIAPLVGQSMATVDVTVWFWGRLAMADDRPGMRLIAWNMLKAGLEDRLREEVLQDFNWRLILDSPVVDWRTVLTYQGRQMGLPTPVTDLAIGTLGAAWTAPATHADGAIPFDRLDMVTRAGELRFPSVP